MRIWINNTDGKPDAVLTMTLAGFVVVLVKFLLSNVVLTLADRTFNFGSVDGSMIGALLTPTLGAYCARRYTDRKFTADTSGGADESDPTTKKEE